MSRLLVLITIIFCAGIIFAGKAKINFCLLYLFAQVLIFLCFVVRRKIISQIVTSLMIFSIGVLVFTNFRVISQNHILRFVYFNADIPYLVKGCLINEPEPADKGINFILKSSQLQFNKVNIICCGDILVHLNGSKDLHYGDEVELIGKLHKPFAFAGLGRSSFKDYLGNQGIYAILNIDRAANAKKTGISRGAMLKKFSIFAKGKMEEIIFKYMPGFSAGIMDAMILGEKKGVPPIIYNRMMRTGTVHILVVSGFNVGIVGFIVAMLLKIMRVPRKPRVICVLACLFIYCLMTGATNPVVRATIMATVYLLACFFRREPDILNTCCLAALLMLLINPNQLFDIGFQLSFMSVIAIVCLYPRFKALSRIESLKTRLLRFVAESFLVSFSAWIGTVSIIAYNFRSISFVTVLANIFVVPLATLITLSGISLVVSGLIFPPVAAYIASLSELLVSVLLKVNAFMSNLPGAYLRLP